MQRNNLRYLILFIFANVQGLLHSQWYPVPHPIVYVPKSTFPEHVLVLGDGHILYSSDVSVSPSSGGYRVEYRTSDDGNTISCNECGKGAPIPSYGCCSSGGFSAFNSSVFLRVVSSQGWQAIHYKRYNTEVYFHCPAKNSNIISTFIREDYAYVVACPAYTSTNVFYLNKINGSFSQTSTTLSAHKVEGENKIQFTNDSVGFILCKRLSNLSCSALIKSLNYGASWTEIVIDSLSSITSFYFPSANTGYLAKANGSIYKTTDGGINWSQIYSAPNTIYAINFNTEAKGYIAGNSGLILKTEDGGASWTKEDAGTANKIVKLYSFGDVYYAQTSETTLFKNAPLRNLAWKAEKENQLYLYPIPAKNVLNIVAPSISSTLFDVTITNYLGQTVYSKNNIINTGSNSRSYSLQRSIDVSVLPAGTYLLKVVTNDQTFIKKFIVEN